MTEAIQLIYKCAACCAADRTIQVSSRTEGEDVRSWMDSVIAAVAKDHSQRAPHCTSKTMEYLKIPVGTDDKAYIGAPVKQAVQ